MTGAPAAPRDDRVVDAQNPWPGLQAFTEELSGFFFGRTDEADELLRRVRRNIVTVLFGQSGLGKTSLLRAGLSPRLRAQGFLPVFVRLDHAPTAPPASAQIMAALGDALQRSARAGTALPPETATLWEYLHVTDVHLVDRDGSPVQPVIILDQFEELFTLAHDGEVARARRQAFITELAGLIENRSPADVKRRLESDPDLADLIDFDRQPYRILLSLREDYLAHLQDLRALSPSIAQNLMRLTRMNGRQALAAVIEPGGRLVSHQVGPLIVQFVSDAHGRRDGDPGSGITELAELEVEPSLLSLVCRELNNRRLALGLSEITPELTDRSRKEILSDFYDRSFDELPLGSRDAVRAWIEDALLTDSGFRENVALERAEKALTAVGAPPDTIEILRRRRLIRIEERLRVKRVELIHDVLVEPVVRSRGERQQRQTALAAQRREEDLKARQKAEAEEAQRRERELQQQLSAKRRQVRQVRLFAIGMTVLAVLAGAFFWGGVQQQTRLNKQAAVATQSIQKMVLYLSNRTDSAPELRPVYRTFLAEMDSLLTGMQEANPGTAAVMQLLAYYPALQADLSLKDNERGQAASLAVLAEARAGELARRQGDPVFRDGAMAVYGMIARTLKDLDSLPRARAAVDSALGIALRMDTAARNERRNWLAGIYDLSREVREAQHDSMGALNAARQRLLIERSLTSDSASQGQLLDLGLAFETLALRLRMVDSLGAAVAAHDSTIAVLRRGLAVTSDSVDDRERIRFVMAAAHSNRGEAEGDLKQAAAARASYSTAIAMLDSLLAGSPDNNRYRRRLARTLGRLADVTNITDPALAERSYERMVPLYSRLVVVDSQLAGGTGTQDDMANLASDYEWLGWLRQKRGDRAGALRMYRSSVAVASRLVSRDSSPANRSRLADALGTLAWVEVINNQPSEAERDALRGIAVDSTRLNSYAHLTYAYLLTNRYPEAERIYQEYRCAKVGDSTFAAVLVDDFNKLAKYGVVNANTRRLDAIARAESCQGLKSAAGAPG